MICFNFSEISFSLVLFCLQLGEAAETLSTNTFNQLVGCRLFIIFIRALYLLPRPLLLNIVQFSPVDCGLWLGPEGYLVIFCEILY